MLIETESFRNALLRLVAARLRRAERYVRDIEKDPERSVHELRRTSKELRSLWRMIRPLVDEEVYARENIRLRDAARAMAGARDAAVMLSTLDRMKSRRRNRRARDAWRQLSLEFQSHITQTLGETALQPIAPEALQPALAGALEAFRATAELIENLPAESALTWQPGVERVYRQGRKRMKKAYAEGTDVDFHNWRKATKYLFFQLRLLERMKLARPGKRVKELNKLEKLLGRDHDLVVLREKISALAAADGNPRELVIDDIARDSARNRKVARKPGKKLFADKPVDYIASIEKPSRRRVETPPAPAEETTENS